MKNVVSLTARAEQDRQLSFEWYAENYSIAFATQWTIGITKAMHSLAHMPERCHKARENEYFPFRLYELLFGRRMRHRIIFQIHVNEVIVLHIQYSAQRDLTEVDL
jgi:plasmid stabilization system protein ParE